MLDNQELNKFISDALREDVHEGDHSSLASIDKNAQGKAKNPPGHARHANKRGYGAAEGAGDRRRRKPVYGDRRGRERGGQHHAGGRVQRLVRP